MLMAAAMSSSALVAQAPTPSPIRTFGNWAVACDNGLRCMAVSLQPAESDYKGIGLVIERDAGPNGTPTARLAHIYDAHRGPAEISVDGHIVASGELDGSENMNVAKAVTPVVMRALVVGTRLHLSGGGETSDTALDGAAAAFRYMDAQQGRVGTRTAIVAKGTAMPVAVPTGSVPTVTAIHPPATSPAIAPAMKADLWARAGCERAVGADAFFKIHTLSHDTTLVLVSCGMDGAYNSFQSPYIVRRGSAVIAPFDAPVGMGERGSRPSITSGLWDPKTATLTSYERGRALGDCASQETFVWDGNRFRLVELDELDQCRGGQTLLTLWRAKPVFTGIDAVTGSKGE